jgi:hypothetical protein
VVFDPKRHTIKVQGGRDYLPVSARLVWFRQEHPDWGIVTQAVEINLEKQYAIFSCTIFNEEGRVMATATKMENVKGFGDYLEKAETGAVGRALAMCGYGTAFAPELEDGARYGGNNANRYPARQNAPPPGPSRPMPQESTPQPHHAPVRPPIATPRPLPEHEEDLAPPVARTSPTASLAPVSRVPEDRPAPNAPITRVKEPERDLVDPGGDFDDEEDPFENEEVALPVRPPVAARPNGGERRPIPPETLKTAANRPAPSEEPVEKEKNSLPRCTVEGCANVLTQGQMSMSQQKFGRAICLMHQRDPAITGTTNGARRNPL